MKIYAILNTTNDKIYIGKTIQPGNKRIDDHFSRLRSGKHGNTHLQHAFKKYGEDSFDWIDLEDDIQCEDKLHELERKYILGAQSYKGANGYNQEIPGASPHALKAERAKERYNQRMQELMAQGCSKAFAKRVIRNQRAITQRLPYKQRKDDRHKRTNKSNDEKYSKMREQLYLGKPYVILDKETGRKFRTPSEAKYHTGRSVKFIQGQLKRTDWSLKRLEPQRFFNIPPEGGEIPQDCLPFIDMQTNIVYRSVAEASRQLKIQQRDIKRALASKRRNVKRRFIYID